MDNEPAFPNPGFDNGPGNFRGRPADGMSLRDYFAAKALPLCVEEFWRGIRSHDFGIPPGWKDGLALEAYEYADAMLKAREAPNG